MSVVFSETEKAGVCASFSYFSFFLAFSMKMIPMMMNGMESSCPMLNVMVSSKSSWFSFVSSMKNLNVKIYVRHSPK